MDKYRILIVDDHAVWRQGLRDLLRNEPDLEVVGECADGNEAMQMITSLNPDVVLMDVNMPGMNGLQVTRQVKTERHKAIIITLTAYDDAQ